MHSNRTSSCAKPRHNEHGWGVWPSALQQSKLTKLSISASVHCSKHSSRTFVQRGVLQYEVIIHRCLSSVIFSRTRASVVEKRRPLLRPKAPNGSALCLRDCLLSHGLYWNCCPWAGRVLPKASLVMLRADEDLAHSASQQRYQIPRENSTAGTICLQRILPKSKLLEGRYALL